MKSFLRTFALHLISVFLVLGGFVAYAVSYPSTTPIGEIPGGVFMEYFNKILVNTGTSTDGTVKQSASIGNASNPSMLTINGNNLQINSVATSETACSSVGLLARDSNGVPLTCQTSGSAMSWKKISGGADGNAALATAYEPSWSALIGATGQTTLKKTISCTWPAFAGYQGVSMTILTDGTYSARTVHYDPPHPYCVWSANCPSFAAGKNTYGGGCPGTLSSCEGWVPNTGAVGFSASPVIDAKGALVDWYLTFTVNPSYGGSSVNVNASQVAASGTVPVTTYPFGPSYPYTIAINCADHPLF